MAYSPPALSPTQQAAFNNATALMLPKWRIAVGKVKANVASCRILCIGDSITAGQWAQGNVPANQRPLSWPTQLSNMLNSSGVNANWNSTLGNNNTGFGETTPTLDFRVVQGTGWTSSSAAETIGGDLYASTSATSNLAFTPTFPVNTFNIFYPLFSGGGTLAANLNGGSNTNVSLNNATTGINTLTLSTTLGINTCNLNWNAGSAFAIGWEAYDSSKKWVSIINTGWDGATSTDMALHGAGFNSGSAISYLAPALTIICTGINDWDNGISLATYTANIQYMITQAKLSGDVILVSPVPTNPAAGGAAPIATQLTYIAALQTIATSNNIPLVDVYNRWVSYAVSQPLGYYGDTFTHPIGAGYGDMAQAIFNVIGNT